MIKVSIAKLGNPIQEVELDEAAHVMDALKLADYNLDSVLSVKRNGVVVTMDTILADGDVLLVSQDKIKGGNEEGVEVTNPVLPTEGNLIKINFDITHEDIDPTSKAMLFMDDMSAFEIIKTVLHGRDISMNNFKELKDVNGTRLGLDTKLVDGAKYVIVLERSRYIKEEDDLYEY
jgi:hypothetical protein